jgi:hypothetical protein
MYLDNFIKPYPFESERGGTIDIDKFLSGRFGDVKGNMRNGNMRNSGNNRNMRNMGNY